MSLTKVSYSMIQGSSANVLDFGADPTGATDSTVAFQAALDAAKVLTELVRGAQFFLSIFQLHQAVFTKLAAHC